jgi:membrane protein YdbS with pleckstrin-like domain
MKFKFWILLISSYLIAFSTNLIPSLKHPDSNISIFNLLATFLLLIAFLIVIKKVWSSGKLHKSLKRFLLVGFISGLVIYGIKIFEDTLMNYNVLDMIASIQYPIYLLFITPLFGMNYLFDMGYGNFSLLISVVYIFILFAVITFKKADGPNV